MNQEKLQTIFDTAVTGVVNQNLPSVDSLDNKRCLYRGQNGLKCAAGHILPDSEYNPSMEGKSIGDIPYLSKIYDENPNAFFLICELRLAHDEVARHDNSNFIEGFKDRVKEIGERYGLNLSCLVTGEAL